MDIENFRTFDHITVVLNSSQFVLSKEVKGRFENLEHLDILATISSKREEIPEKID